MTWRYLVTGAQGFVGRFVVADILRNIPDSYILGVGRSDRKRNRFTHHVSWNGEQFSAPLPSELPDSLFSDSRYEYVPVDLGDVDRLAAVIAEFEPNRIVHMASGLWGDDYQKLFRCNVEGVANLLTAVGEWGGRVDSIVLGSSGGVYGNPCKLPLLETSATNPIHMYSVSKLAGEMTAGVIARQFSLPIRIARIFNIVGPGQDERHVCGRWIAELSAIAMGLKPANLQVGSLDPTRDMIDVRDVASAIRVLSERGENGECYNVASGIETKMHNVLAACVDITGLKATVQIENAFRRAVDLPRHFASISKIEGFAWKPKFSLVESLRDLHRYYVDCVAPLSLKEFGDSHV